MPTADLGELTLYYETHGRRADPALVLIRGLGTQLIEWPAALVDGFVTAGFFVIAFDNRDVGLSSEVTAPYRLEDMADDTVALCDALAIERAHVFGISLGGMIAQHVAMRHPERVASLISVMSSSGNPALPQPTPEMRARLTESAADAEALIALNAENRAIFGSPGYPEPLAERLAASRAAFERSYRPAGVARQMQAAIADGSRVERLHSLAVPALVIHGADDPLIPVAAGRDTADAIPGARLVVIEGMGHNIPAALAPHIVGQVVAFVRELAR
jgi:pimeloyl-ACP methyl ester carboxylesterase